MGCAIKSKRERGACQKQLESLLNGKAGTVSHGSNYLLLRHEKIGENKQINNMDKKGKYCREEVVMEVVVVVAAAGYLR